MIKNILAFCLLVILLSHVEARAYISDFGAIPNSDTYEATLANQQAFLKAIKYVNTTHDNDRVVVVPNHRYYTLHVHTENVHNLTLLVLGKIIATKSVRDWERKPNSTDYWQFFTFYYCDNLTISGGGKFDGRGYHWWMLTLLDIKPLLHDESGRPHMFEFFRCRNITMHDLILKNSPQFHVKMDDCNRALMYNIDIKVNTTAQVNLLKRFSLEGVIPMFPFNTDGIDPHGSNMYMFNMTVQNWDDVVVPKPGSRADLYDTCTQNYLVENITVVLGVGMTIGSISPSTDYNCIRNVTFRNIHMSHPWKGIYIKTNPGDVGGGIVENIAYHNLTMINPRWWAIYIGPQQMKEPDGDGPGCMIYPLDPKGKCTTQPLITIRNITLKDIDIQDSLFYPITLRCNVSNPCREFEFTNVKTNKWKYGQKNTGMVCEYATGKQSGCEPPVYCFYNSVSSLQREPIELEMENISQLLDAAKWWKIIDEAVVKHPYVDSDDDDQTLPDEILAHLRMKGIQFEM